MNLQRITITKSSLYFRECKACGCVTLHVGKVTPQMPPGSTYNDCLQCLVDTQCARTEPLARPENWQIADRATR